MEVFTTVLLTYVLLAIIAIVVAAIIDLIRRALRWLK